MEFDADLEGSAFRTASGEYAWPRPEAIRAVHALADAGLALLGGELWLVKAHEIQPMFPVEGGGQAVLGWASNRLDSEAWSAFVTRSRSESLAAIAAQPSRDVSVPEGFGVYYNVTWADQTRFALLSEHRAEARRGARPSL